MSRPLRIEYQDACGIQGTGIQGTRNKNIESSRVNSRTGRPFGPDSFYSIIENITERNPRPGLPGRPKKNRIMSPELQKK